MWGPGAGPITCSPFTQLAVTGPRGAHAESQDASGQTRSRRWVSGELATESWVDPPSDSPRGGAGFPRPCFRAGPCPPVSGGAQDTLSAPVTPTPPPTRGSRTLGIPCSQWPSSLRAQATDRPGPHLPRPRRWAAERRRHPPRVTCSPRLGASAGGERGDTSRAGCRRRQASSPGPRARDSP